jgi:hypothetical protein
VDSAAQAESWVDRIIAYEENPPTLTNFYDRVALAAYFQDSIYVDGYADRRFAQTAEDLAKFFSEAPYGISKTVTRIFYTQPAVDPQYWSTGAHTTQPNFGGGPAGGPGAPIPSYLEKPGFPWDGDATDIKGAIEPGGGTSGSFLLTHNDHGNRQYWVDPYFGPLNIAGLQLQWGESPVVWSINCQTGWFDNETDFSTLPGIVDLTGDTEESFAEFFANYCAAGGPVGLIAATRVTDSIYNDRLTWGFTDAIWPSFISSYPPIAVEATLRMGDVLSYGKAYMATMVPDNNWRLLHREAYHWFGDPSMEIRTEYPDWLTASYDSNWPWLGQSHALTVHVENTSGPLAMATVALTFPGNLYQHWMAVTDASGNAVLPGIITTESGTYDLTVTASNHVPFQGSLYSYQTHIFSDGFNDGHLGAWSSHYP